MSNVKVNGNTYNGVNSVKLPLADGSGFATYAEGAVTSDITDNLLSDQAIGNLTNDTVSAVNLYVFRGKTCGTVEFTEAVEVFGACNVVADNMLFPKAAKWGYRNAEFTQFKSCNVSGTIDLSAIASGLGFNQAFWGATIGTLKIGKIGAHNGMFQNAKITNLVWNNPDITADAMGGAQGLGSSGATITNAYVPDSQYDGIKALKDAGTLTTVTNLYKISEWSGE